MRRLIVLSILSVSALLGSSSITTAQFVDQGNGPAANVRQRGARRPGLMVQAGIANYLARPVPTARESPDLNYRVNLLTELITNVLAQLRLVIGFLPTFLDGGSGLPGGGSFGGGGVDTLVITEIGHNGSVVFVELLSRAPLRFSLSGWHFADESGVSPSLPPIVLERNESVVIQLGGEVQDPLADTILGFRVQSLSAGELALYDFSQSTGGLLPIENSRLMVDYVQWNNDDRDRDPPLEDIAVDANLWSGVDAIRSSLSNMSFRLTAGAEGRTSSSSREFIVVSFGENTLGTPESQLTPGG